MKFKKYLGEAQKLNWKDKKSGRANYSEDADEFAKKLEGVMKKYFPKSFTQAKFSKSIAPSITMRFALGKSNSEWTNGIIQNDPLFHIWFIHDLYEGMIPEKIKIELTTGGHIGVFDWEDAKGTKHKGPGFDFKFPKIGWRNKKGTPDQILKHFDNYFKKMKDAAKKYKNSREFELTKKKI